MKEVGEEAHHLKRTRGKTGFPGLFGRGGLGIAMVVEVV